MTGVQRREEGASLDQVASLAGLSKSNLLYYFASKEHLVQAFYDGIQVDHAAAAAPVLSRETSFEGRLRRAHFWIGFLIIFGANVVLGWIPILGWLISLARKTPHST